MILRQVILSKRPFKIPGMQWLIITNIGQIVEEKTLQPVYLTADDMLSENWIMREKESLITKSHLDRMFGRLKTVYPERDLTALFQIIKEELGFLERT